MVKTHMATFTNTKKTFSLNKALPSTWRQIFLVYSNPLFLRRTKYIYDRGSIVPQIFIGHRVRIRSGNKFHSRVLNRWMVGYNYGEFSWTRKLALYKAKQLKKKKKKN